MGGAGAESPQRFMERILTLNALLSEFSIIENRNAFLISGITNDQSEDKVLQGLDAISKVLFPAWSPIMSNTRRDFEIAVLHLQFLFSASSLCFDIDPQNTNIPRYSYATWLGIICKIDREKLFHRGDSETQEVNGRKCSFEADRKTEASSPKLESKHAVKRRSKKLHGSKKLSNKPRRCLSLDSGSCSSDGDEVEVSKKISTKCKKTNLQLIESSESSSAISEDSSSDSCENLISDSSSSNSYCRKQKDFVLPVKFGDDDSYSLRRYLRVFERYFYARYNGTQKECSQELGEFLIGDTKEAYYALGGGQIKYRELKPKLLEWYQAQRCSKVHRLKFEGMEIKPNESLNLFCIRLENGVIKAYPKDPKRQSRALKEKIWKNAPPSFVNLLEKKKELKQLMNLGKSVSWSDIVELAIDEDRKVKRDLYEKFQEQKTFKNPSIH